MADKPQKIDIVLRGGDLIDGTGSARRKVDVARVGDRVAGLVEPGLSELRANGARGCAVLGDPGFYGRFGFRSVGALRYGALPVRLVQWIAFEGDTPSGELSYARAFDLARPYGQPRL